MPSLHILYIAYPLLTVSDESAGGAEQVLWTLERELARRGVCTTVAASAGSRIAGELFSTGDPCTQPDDYERRNREHQERTISFIEDRVREGRGFDLVHDMSGSFWSRAAEIDLPVLATLHLPRSFYPPQYFQNVPANVSLNCVSHSQAHSFSDLKRLIGVVPNGIVLDRFEPEHRTNGNGNPSRRQGLLWLGRICEEKAPHLALEIAARSGLPITLTGQIYPFSYHQQYFEREVAPRLQQMPNATLITSPTFEQKRKLLREAQALLITSLANETSSLVAIEAAASGTPVIAFRHGALSEIVREGVTGFLADDVEGASAACQRIVGLNPAACLQYARATFSSAAMAAAYLQLYESVIRPTKTLQTMEA
ncbi:MAG TPA: glycosyltransferase [Candidatus Angelobacter sp.]|nr:glycosyltransferase [Candidatus Angelobacter sp.]